MTDSIDRKILFALRDGPMTGARLVRRLYCGTFGIGRIHNISTKAFCQHLNDLVRQNLLACSRPEDPAEGEWSLVPT